jgi:hypothetical protein
MLDAPEEFLGRERFWKIGGVVRVSGRAHVAAGAENRDAREAELDLLD